MDHLEAIKTFLASLSYTTYLVWADTVSGQYLILTGPAWDMPAEMPISATSTAFETDVRVKAVAGTADGVGIMLKRVRDLLSPNLAEVQIPLTGRAVRARFARGEFVSVDQDTTIVGTNRHPFVGVETYHLTSEPL